jgi:hypothetical protein
MVGRKVVRMGAWDDGRMGKGEWKDMKMRMYVDGKISEWEVGKMSGWEDGG